MVRVPALNLDSKAIAKADGAEIITDEAAERALVSCELPLTIKTIRDRATAGAYLSQFITGLLQAQGAVYAVNQEKALLAVTKLATDHEDPKVKIEAAKAVASLSLAWVGTATTQLKLTEINGIQRGTVTGQTLAPQIRADQAYVQVNIQSKKDQSAKAS